MPDPSPVKPIKILSERCGGPAPQVLESMKRHRQQSKAILAALAEEPMSVVEVASATGMEVHEALWLLMALKKYGKIVEGEEREDCFAYQLTT